MKKARRYHRLAERAKLEEDYLSGARLQLELDWWAKEQPTAVWAERYGGDFKNTRDFLDDSKAEKKRQDQEAAAQLQLMQKHQQETAEAKARAHEKAKSNRRLRLLVVGLAVAVLFAAFSAYNALNERDKAKKLTEEVTAVKDALGVALQEAATAHI